MLTRSQRRAISRDEARANPVPPRPQAHGFYADHVNARVPMPVRPPSARSGQQRVNAKRNQRAEYWRTVKVRVSVEIEPYFRQYLHLLGHGTRIQGRTELLWEFAVDLDVHIPGAPEGAVAAEPVYQGVFSDGEYVPELNGIQWYGTDGELMTFPDAVLVAAS